MYLPARVPNLGAHKLAWIIGTAVDAEAEISSFAVAMAGNPNVLDRLLSGELVPGADMAARILFWSQYVIDRRDWRRPVGQRWGEEPVGWFTPEKIAA